MFSGLAALTNYELNGVLYTSSAPVSLFVYTILTTVLPFLLGAVISFVVAALSSQQEKLADEKETETQPKATEAAETQPTPEEDFKA